MKQINYWSWKHSYLYGAMFTLIALSMIGCKDDKDEGEAAYDPTRPVIITDFTPKSGGFGSNLILYGDNFGNDTTKIKVTVGGIKANIITLKNKSLYCVVPQRAYDGDIQVFIYDDNGQEVAFAEADGLFEYEKKWLVTTFIGTRYENSRDEVEKEGPFDDTGCFNSITWLSFDPKSDFDHLYLTTHESPPNRFIDFRNEYVSYFTTTDLDRPAIINWMADETADMVLSDDQGNDNRVGNYIYTRASNFQDHTSIGQNAPSTCGAMIHPVNGELYYSGYYSAEVLRYDFETKETTVAFVNLRGRATYRMVVHPTGNHAYIMQYYYYNGPGSGTYIARTDYDWEKKTFTNPYLVCGKDGERGYVDGVGDKARVSGPSQGVFVKNPEYEGEADEYDFYFCDESNHAIRIINPQGRVSTYAGRGNNGTSGYADGELRTEARFNQPYAIAYDEKRECFYVGDKGNKVIRKIAREE